MEQNLNQFCQFVQTLLQSQVKHTLQISKGRKYTKLISVDTLGSRSVWCFVDQTNGDILKAATWSAPAKHARGNISRPESYQNYEWTGPHYLK
jgi:hypothetical protein